MILLYRGWGGNLTTAPMVSTASKLPLLAMDFATSGSSKLPGTQNIYRIKEELTTASCPGPKDDLHSDARFCRSLAIFTESHKFFHQMWATPNSGNPLPRSSTTGLSPVTFKCAWGKICVASTAKAVQLVVGSFDHGHLQSHFWHHQFMQYQGMDLSGDSWLLCMKIENPKSRYLAS